MIGAFAYLTVASFRNRMAARARRLRSPRYLIGLALGVTYIWFFLFRPGGMAGGGDSRSALMGPDALQTLAALGLLVAVAAAWIFSSNQLALAFTPAEVQFLFPAPVTRRGLVAYKLVRVQLLIVFNAVIWVFLLRRHGSPLPDPLRAIAIWAVFCTLYLHRVGAALVRTSWVQHGGAGIRRHPIALLALVAALGAVAWTAVTLAPAMRAAADVPEALRAALAASHAGAAAIVLAPLRWLLAPTFAPTPGAWAAALPRALALLAAMGLWVFRSDVAFEEAAASASAERAKLIARVRMRHAGVSVAKGGKRTLPLSPTGHPAVALAWKNTLALARTVNGRFLLVMTMLVLAFAVVFGQQAREGLSRLVAAGSGAALMLLVLAGPRMVRSDLRQDLAYLSLLKTYPLRGRTIVLAEVGAAALILGALQSLVLAIGVGALLMDPATGAVARQGWWVLLVAPLAFVTLDMVLLTIYNGTAVLFPAWTPASQGAAGANAGVEVLGQNLLTTIASLLLLGIALIPPGLGVAAAIAIFKRGPFVYLVAGWAAVGVLAVELWLVMEWLGRVLDRAEPQEGR